MTTLRREARGLDEHLLRCRAVDAVQEAAVLNTRAAEADANAARWTEHGCSDLAERYASMADEYRRRATRTLAALA